MNDARLRFLSLLRGAITSGQLEKLTLGRYRGTDAGLRNLSVRPVTLKAGPRLAFVWKYATREVAKNRPAADAVAELEKLIGADFLDAHLFTQEQVAQLECRPEGGARLHTAPRPHAAAASPTPEPTHDHTKKRLIAPESPWLQALGVTRPNGHPMEGMAPKCRQIQRFIELLEPLLSEAGLMPASASETPPLNLFDMGCGKGYLTFAVSAFLGARARVHGVEARPELVAKTNAIAAANGFAGQLNFIAGTIADTPIPSADALIALHACDTATDDALAKGVAAGAKLLVVSPCCQKELRPQLTAPPVLADALQHGIFQERQAEFVTDALRAQLLEWAGYRAKVFEFISTEHTAKNLMIAAIKTGPGHDPQVAAHIQAFAAFYGIKHQSLATQLGFRL